MEFWAKNPEQKSQKNIFGLGLGLTTSGPTQVF